MKILLIAPSTYGFFSHIINSISSLDINVNYFDEHAIIKKGLITRVFYKLPFKFLTHYHNKYISKILDRASSDYDLVIVIRGEFISPESIISMKRKFNKARFVMYQWDFEANLPLLHSQIPYFDVIYSFDKADCETFGFKHKALFFNTLHEQASSASKKYLFNFVGTDHSDRNKVIKDFIEINDIDLDEFYLHLFRPKKSILLNILKSPKFLLNRDFSLYKHFPLDENKTIKSMAESEIIIDITQPDQTGLTMRTIEALGLKRKLITTNKDIVNYDFYHPNNIYIIERDSLKIPESFITCDYIELDRNIYDKYHIDNWVKELITLQMTSYE